MRVIQSWFALVPACAVCVHLASAQQSVPRKQSAADTAFSGEPVRLYLSPIRVDSGYRLTPNSYTGATHVEQNVNFADSGDSARAASVIGVATRAINTWNGVQFVSPPLAGPFDLSGTFTGRLDLVTNTPHFDFQLSLYELTPAGDYILVSSYSTRERPDGMASPRAPLQVGTRQYRDYQSSAFASRRVQNGSRLVLLITILEPANAASAYLTRGGDSTNGDLGAPLSLGWYGDSYIELRVRHH